MQLDIIRFNFYPQHRDAIDADNKDKGDEDTKTDIITLEGRWM